MSYRYRVLGADESEKHLRAELDLAYLTAEIAAMKLKIAAPRVRFFAQSSDGYISRDQSIDGYCPSSSEIFIKNGLPAAVLVRTVLHESRHAWQLQQPSWSKRNDQTAEADAKTFALELWGEFRSDNDHEKILVAMAMAANELRVNRHPAVARLNKRRESPRTNLVAANNVPITAAEVKDYYYRVALPKLVAARIKPHLRPFRAQYLMRGYQDERT